MSNKERLICLLWLVLAFPLVLYYMVFKTKWGK